MRWGAPKWPPIPPNVRSARAEPWRSSVLAPSRVSFFRAGPVVLLVRGDLRHEIEETPVAFRLTRSAAAPDPHALERLVVARPPPLLALEVVVGGILPE